MEEPERSINPQELELKLVVVESSNVSVLLTLKQFVESARASRGAIDGDRDDVVQVPWSADHGACVCAHVHRIDAEELREDRLGLLGEGHVDRVRVGERRRPGIEPADVVRRVGGRGRARSGRVREILRPGHGGRVGSCLEVALLGEPGAPVDHERHDPEEDDHENDHEGERRATIVTNAALHSTRSLVELVSDPDLTTRPARSSAYG